LKENVTSTFCLFIQVFNCGRPTISQEYRRVFPHTVDTLRFFYGRGMFGKQT